MRAAGILSGLKVVEFAAIGPVPWAGMVLADFGANVVRVEASRSAGEKDTLGSVNRGRLRLELDLKTSEGLEAARSLIERADVLLEGMRPGVMERLGLGPEEAVQRNPRLVYARMTGWGQTGPNAQQAGHDINYIALTGALHAIGPYDTPVLPLNLVGDFGGGSTFLLVGLLAALLKSRSTGRGQVVDVAMVDGATALMTTVYSRMNMGQWVDQRARNALDGGVPWYGVYRTRDGKFMAVGALESKFYHELVNRLGIAEHVPDRNDPTNWPDIRRRLAEQFASRTRDEWAVHFRGTDACVSPVLSLAEAPFDPHLQARGTFAGSKGGPIPASAPVFNGLRHPLADPSHHTTLDDVLRSWSKET